MVARGLAGLAMSAWLGAAMASQPQGGVRLDLPRTLVGPLSAESLDEEQRERAELSLDAVLERIAPAPPDPGEAAAVALPLEVVKLYARGRQLRLAGDYRAAVEALRAASSRAPSAARVWRELGEALAQAGDRAAAIEALSQAVNLGLNQPNTLLALAADAAAGGRTERAAALLARARASEPQRYDPALLPMVQAELGRTLVELGYFRAGAEALREAIGTLGALHARSAFAPQLQSLMQREGELWLMIGDAEARLGDESEALGAWSRAARHRLPPAQSILARRVRLLAEAGRLEEAEGVLVEAARERGMRFDERALLVARALGETRGEPLAGLASAARAEVGTAESPSERAWLWRLHAAGLGAKAARAALLDAWAEDGDELLLVDLLALAEGADDLTALAGEALRRRPMAAADVAEALVVASADFEATLGALKERDDAASRALSALLLSRRGEHAAGLGRLDGMSGRQGLEPGVSEIEALLAARAGEGERAERALSRLVAAADWRHALARVRVLRALQRFAEAEGLAQRSLQRRGLPEAARRELLVELAAIAGARGDGQGRRESLVAVLEVDRHFQPAIEELLQGAASEADPLAERLRTLLTEEMRQSRLTRLLAAQQEIARGDRGDAETQLAQLALESPIPDEALQLLVGLWRQDREGGGAAARRGLNWLDRHMADRRHLAALARARATLLAAVGEQEAANAALAAALPGRELGSATVVGERIERATQRARRGELAEAARVLEALGAGVELSAGQGERLLQAAGRWFQSAAQEPEGEQREGVLALLDALAPRLRELPMPMHELRTALLATLRPAPLERIERAVARAMSSSDGEGRAIAAAPLLFLAQTRRGEEAIELRDRLWPLLDLDNVRVLEATLVVAMLAGEGADLRLPLEGVRQPGTLLGVVRSLTSGADVEADGSRTLDELRAEVAYLIANSASTLGREEAGLEMYRVALGFDPGHVWAANNLGYLLAERGERLEEAERLIELAYRERPDSASIVDSLGWVRYLRGELEDQAGPGGAQAGAATLLRRAAELSPTEEVSPTILEHLGDALWRIGEREEAQDAWKRALERAAADLDRLEEIRAPEAARRGRREQVDRLEARLRAVEAGEEPAVAPMPVEDAPQSG